MRDERIDRLARLLVRYSIRPKKRDVVAIIGGTPAEPLIEAVYREVLQAGAHPSIRMSPERLSETFFKYGKPHHFRELHPYARTVARHTDSEIAIYSQTNTRSLSGIDPARQAMFSSTMKPVGDIRRKKPWVLTLFPTEAYAQDAEMSLSDFEDYVYSATFVDRRDPVAAWRKLSCVQDRLIAELRGADAIRIVGPGTDLKLSVKGRKFINSDGRHNIPSGEVFTGPVESSADGYIEFDFPVCRGGREIDGIRLVFRRGVVVEATAKKNEKFLKRMLDMDSGARRLGELGIGTNKRIDRFVRNILFDEKIGGTVHLALGQSYSETGGKNVSALHWDMIKDLRRGGALYVDGNVFQMDGRFRQI